MSSSQLDPDGQPEGLVPIYPDVRLTATCPRTGQALHAVDWVIPGMWSLAKMESDDGSLSYWMDFPYSLGLLAPTYMDTRSGEVFSAPSVAWYARALGEAWAARSNTVAGLRVVKFRECRRVVLLNCLYPWYGDAVSLLLRANALWQHGLDVIALVTPNMERLLPKYLAEAWIVEANSYQVFWNDGLGRRVKEEVARFDACSIPRNFKPVLLSQGELQEITGIVPFSREDWSERLLKGPVVTFFIREDRCWVERSEGGFIDRFLRGPLRSWRETLARRRNYRAMKSQERRLAELVRRMRAIAPNMEFAVCGVKGETQLPAGVKDLRVTKMDAQVNRRWDEQCARSHVVIAVHGSHTMPHNGFSGSYIELVPLDKWANLLNTPFVTTTDLRETLFCYRFLPVGIDPEELALVTLSLIYNYASVRFAYHHDFPEPLSDAHYEQLLRDREKRLKAIDACGPELRRMLAP